MRQRFFYCWCWVWYWSTEISNSSSAIVTLNNNFNTNLSKKVNYSDGKNSINLIFDMREYHYANDNHSSQHEIHSCTFLITYILILWRSVHYLSFVLYLLLSCCLSMLSSTLNVINEIKNLTISFNSSLTIKSKYHSIKQPELFYCKRCATVVF